MTTRQTRQRLRLARVYRDVGSADSAHDLRDAVAVEGGYATPDGEVVTSARDALDAWLAVVGRRRGRPPVARRLVACPVRVTPEASAVARERGSEWVSEAIVSAHGREEG